MLASVAAVLLANALGQAPTSTMAPPAPFPYCGMPLQLKSWKGDYLNRSDATPPSPRRPPAPPATGGPPSAPRTAR